MSTEHRLSEIWSQDYIKTLPSIIKERGFFYADNEKKDILITGFNPSYRTGDIPGNFHGSIRDVWYNEKYDNYWSPIKKMLISEESQIDLRQYTDYLDIFYFREQTQNFLRKFIVPNTNGIKFIIDQLNLTQHIIEDVVCPKLIIVKNKESWAYFGKLFEEKGWIWMGYQLEFVQKLICGELYMIKGLINSSERISPELRKTNLDHTYVLFVQHINQYTKIDKRPTPVLLKTILDNYNSETLFQ